MARRGSSAFAPDVIDLEGDGGSKTEEMDLTVDSEEDPMAIDSNGWGASGTDDDEGDEDEEEEEEEDAEESGVAKGTLIERKAARRRVMEEEAQKAKLKEQKRYLKGLRKALEARENMVFEFEEVAYDPTTLRANLERLHAPPELMLTEFMFTRPPIPPMDDDEPLELNLNQVNKELTCPVCLSIVSDTRTVRECLHRFCAACINKSLRLGKKECPTCRANCNSQRHLRQDPRFDMIVQRLNPDLEAYEATQEETIKQINTSFNTTALRKSIEEGMKRQADSARRSARPPRSSPTVSVAPPPQAAVSKKKGRSRTSESSTSVTEPVHPQGAAATKFSVPLSQEGKGTFRSIGGGSKFYIYNHIPKDLTATKQASHASQHKWSISNVSRGTETVAFAHRSNMPVDELESQTRELFISRTQGE